MKSALSLLVLRCSAFGNHTQEDFKAVVTAEDGIIYGGFGRKVASYLGEAPVKVVNLGLPKQFINRYDFSVLQHKCGLAPDQIAETVKSLQ